MRLSRIAKRLWWSYSRLKVLDTGSYNPHRPNLVATRTEEYENDPKKPGDRVQGKDEPFPWGTVVLPGQATKFKSIRSLVNGIGMFVFFTVFLSFMVAIFGELAFFYKIDNLGAVAGSNMHNGTGYLDELHHYHKLDWAKYELLADHWDRNYGDLRRFKRTCVTVLFLLIPYALQVAAMIAHNTCCTMLCMLGLEVHIENFLQECKRYLKTLAMNEGRFPDDAPEQRERNMCRDLGLDIRLKQFRQEIEKDAKVVNGGILLTFVLLASHVLPLTYYAYDRNLCIPVWLLLICVALFVSFAVVISYALKVNEEISGKFREFLSGWTFKLSMVGWGGGFIENDESGTDRGYLVGSQRPV